jgi:MoaA/NifB/PqqE/SkfB family radical SAM enzyme
VAPYTRDMQDERLYAHSISNTAFLDSPWVPHLSLPKMDLEAETARVFLQTLKSGCNISFAGSNFGGANDVCNFIASGSMSIRWDGKASPCWPLMHSHTSYLHGKQRHNRQHIIGSIHEHSLAELWNDPQYVAYRERVQSFVFAPCTFCGGCDLSEANEEDCMGNIFPTCGGCLWAQGVIQCP